MIAVLLITLVFIIVGVYYFFRAEKLQRSLALLKRDTASTQKENQLLSKSMALMAAKNEEFAKNRLQLILNQTQSQNNSNELTLIKPFIDNYSLIFKECFMRKGRLHAITKKCLSNMEGDVYKSFFDTIIKKDSKIQRLWSSNNFIGFISLVEALLVKYERLSQTDSTSEKSTAT